ncbi:DUF2971 domain-containing protein [Bacillus sp. LBG-1-113]|uniref:DUF2971 domain-containing protein n=1 Tax=Bacillus sp. LBG-1-113 TaxID=2886094 RepID=UPI001E5A3378|nr:DUF2971 domain-containing protein [Bacillus sp. LBG-1-113]MCC2929094.1 DUF2971 domain-containing protein [Bacillus sp. LBG-1-113]
MGYSHEQWVNRIAYRADITGHLTHLTKPVYDENGELIKKSISVLKKIIEEKTILGSSTESGFIVGDRRAACFQDMPAYGISQNILHEQNNKDELGNKLRYQGYGLAFTKPYVFERGGRPVIYEKTETAKRFLPRNEYWRIVNYDLDNEEHIIDWTHEREWRVPDQFKFELDEAYILVPNYHSYKKLLERIDMDILKEIKGISVLGSILL